MTTTTTNRRILDGFAFLGSLGVIVAGMSMIDTHTRKFVMAALQGDLQFDISVPYSRLHAMTRVALDTVGRDHTEVAAFVIAGFVLFLMMFRL